MTPYVFPDPTAESYEYMPTCPQCHSDAEVYVTNETVTATEYTCATCGLVFYTVQAIPS